MCLHEMLGRVDLHRPRQDQRGADGVGADTALAPVGADLEAQPGGVLLDLLGAVAPQHRARRSTTTITWPASSAAGSSTPPSTGSTLASLPLCRRNSTSSGPTASGRTRPRSGSIPSPRARRQDSSTNGRARRASVRRPARHRGSCAGVVRTERGPRRRGRRPRMTCHGPLTSRRLAPVDLRPDCRPGPPLPPGYAAPRGSRPSDRASLRPSTPPDLDVAVITRVAGYLA